MQTRCNSKDIYHQNVELPWVSASTARPPRGTRTPPTTIGTARGSSLRGWGRGGERNRPLLHERRAGLRGQRRPDGRLPHTDDTAMRAPSSAPGPNVKANAGPSRRRSAGRNASGKSWSAGDIADQNATSGRVHSCVNARCAFRGFISPECSRGTPTRLATVPDGTS
eukprot:scaffold213066_cov31-Tisochrysis_lutea.AAC.1